MPVVNPLARELVFKIVYYGPGLGGKTTTLQYVHAETRPEHRGKMVSLATPVDRTLYFDYLPIRVPDVRHLAVRLQLFTVPGQVYYNATRKLVLTGSDGVVFVADSQRLRAEANQESYDNLRDNLREHGRELDEMPHVLLFNKRDLPDVLSFEELAGSINRHGAPAFGTVATTGEGVFESLEAIMRLVVRDFEKRVPDATAPDLGGLELPEGGLAEALRRAEGEVPPRVPTPMPPRFRPSGVHGLGLPPNATGEIAARVLAASDARAPSNRPASDPALESSARPDSEAGPDGDHDLAEPDTDHDPAEPTFELRRKENPSPSPATAAPSSDAEPQPSPPAVGPGEGASRDEGFSFARLWPSSERATVRGVEAALAAGEASQVVAGCELLVSRSLAAAAGVLGATTDAPRDPATVCLLLGLEGPRYLRFRALVREVRSGRRLSTSDLMTLFVFAIDVRLARVRTIG